MDQPLGITIESLAPDTVCVALSGELDFSRAYTFDEEMRRLESQKPGSIVLDMTRLNRIRAENPALHSHQGVAFLPAGNDAVLYYEKTTPDRSNCVLCMVSMDPHHNQQTSIELPLWKWGLPDQAELQLEDLLTGARFRLAGKYHTVTLTPQQPYLIWRATPLS